jgi:hypothetical protein
MHFLHFIIDIIISLYQGIQLGILFSIMSCSFVVDQTLRFIQKKRILDHFRQDIQTYCPGLLDQAHILQEALKSHGIRIGMAFFPAIQPIYQGMNVLKQKILIHWTWWKKGGSIPFTTGVDDKEDMPEGENEDSFNVMAQHLLIAVQLLMCSRLDHIDTLKGSFSLRTRAKHILSNESTIKVAMFYGIHRLWDLIFGFEWSRKD